MNNESPVTYMPHSKQTGFSLIEILVAVLVLAIGLIGTASMQAAGLRYSTSSVMESHAHTMIQDLAEMIIAFDSDASGSYEMSTVPAVKPTDCTTTVCSNAELANYNVWLWSTSMSPTLPSYDLDIDFDSATDIYTIILTWDSERAGSTYTASTCTVADSLNPGCFVMTLSI